MSDEKDLVTITRGADKEFFINLTISTNGQPAKAFPLDSPPTKVQVRIPQEDGGVLRLELGPSVIVDDAPGGRLKIVMTEAQTLLLLVSPDDLQDIEVQVVQDIPTAGTTKFFCFNGVLLVKGQKFPETP